MQLSATGVQLASPVEKTPEEIVRRYQQNLDWRLYPKEWIYKNIDFQNRDVLDFGCGTGEITTQLALLGARKVYGLDVTPGLLDSTRRRAELDGVSGIVETITGFVQDVEPRPVDVIIAFAVLHHCFPLERVLPPMLKWLKPGGTFVTVEPVAHFTAMEWLRNRSGVEGDPLDEGERKLTPDDLRYVFSLLEKPAMIPFRLLGRLDRKFPAQEKLLRRMDQAILQLPLTWKLSGTALVTGKKPV